MKKLTFQLVTIFFTLVFSVSIFAANDLNSLLNATTTMQANFAQTVYDSHGKMIQQSTGMMALERPGKFRWDVKKPIPQLVIANGTKLWVYDPDLEQVTIRTVQQGAGDAPALLLSNNTAALLANYNVKLLPQGGSADQVFTLTPKNSGGMFESVNLGFANNQIVSMQMVDGLGHKTNIQFNQIKVNGAVSSALFTFNPPNNVDVIDDTHSKKSKSKHK